MELLLPLELQRALWSPDRLCVETLECEDGLGTPPRRRGEQGMSFLIDEALGASGRPGAHKPSPHSSTGGGEEAFPLHHVCFC